MDDTKVGDKLELGPGRTASGASGWLSFKAPGFRAWLWRAVGHLLKRRDWSAKGETRVKIDLGKANFKFYGGYRERET